MDHLVMSMCRVFSRVVGRVCLLWPLHSLAKLLAFAFSRGSSQPRDETQVSLIAGRFFTNWATRKDLYETVFKTHKRRLDTWTSPDGQNKNQIDYILCSWNWSSSIQSEKTRPGADSGSDHELLIAKFRLKLKKVGKTTRPFRYNLNQTPCDYKVEVTNRLKGIRSDQQNAWRTMDGGSFHWQEGEKIIHNKKKKSKKAKWLSEEALQIA